MKIEEICSFADKSSIKAGEAIEGAEFPFFTSSEDESKRYNKYCFDGEGIIMGTGGNATLHYYNGKFAVSTDCLVLIPNKNIRCKYLYYFFLCNKDVLDAGFRGAGLKHTSKKYIADIGINRLHQLIEQDKILTLLDKLQYIILLRKKQLQKLDLLIKARFGEMFGDVMVNSKKWEIKPLKDICNIVRGGSPRPIDSYLGGTIPWIKISDGTSRDGIYINSTKEYIFENGIKKTRLIKRGSLIFANCGVSLGFCRILNIDGCIHDGWLAFQDIDKNVNKIFLLMTINSLTEYFRSIAPGGTQPNLNIEIMGNYGQIIPPTELQNQFAEFVEKVNKTKESVQKALDKTKLLFDSLMQEYFSC